MARNARDLRWKAERLYRKASRWWSPPSRSERLLRRAVSLERAAALAERRDIETRLDALARRGRRV